MNLNRIHIGKLFLVTALVMLCAGVILGLFTSFVYVLPEHRNLSAAFVALRPMHVSAVLFWILMAATGAVYSALEDMTGKRTGILGLLQWCLWVVAGTGIFYSYFNKQFGGREYWEFDPVWALPLGAAWLIFVINFLKTTRVIKDWPVYLWMWFTGAVFFFFTFIENYLWLLPYFREHFVTDFTIQWKVNGSMVGAWNQLLYGSAFFLMDRITGQKSTGKNRLAFAMYFLGLFNLMFNWGHHIYTLPTAEYVRFVGYGVSMTEWIIFARIIYTWKASVSDAQKNFHHFPYRFLLAADFWVLLNLFQGLMMSVPALNLYTHGTHVTVAHAMGTTIGINSMIALAVCFTFFSGICETTTWKKRLNSFFWLTQGSLIIFWLSLNAAGVQKGIWLMGDRSTDFRTLMQQLQPFFYLFVAAGTVLVFSLSGLALVLLRRYFLCPVFTRSRPTRIISNSNHDQVITTSRFQNS